MDIHVILTSVCRNGGVAQMFQRNRNGKPVDGEMAVMTKAKQLSTYLFQVTQNAPKKFRFSLVGKMQALSLDVISLIYKANETYVPDRTQQPNLYTERATRRLDYAQDALTTMKELDYVIVLAREMLCVTPKQHEQLASHLWNVRNLLGAWIKSERRRYPL